MNDCITAIWTNGYTNYASNNTVYYYNESASYSSSKYYNNVNLNSPQQLGFNFPMQTGTYGVNYEYADHGTGTIYLKRYDYNNQYYDINFKVAYGHKYIGIDANAGFNIVTGDFVLYLNYKQNTTIFN